MNDEPAPNRPLDAQERLRAQRHSDAQMREEQRLLREESERTRQRFQATKVSIRETWQRLVRGHEDSSLDRDLRRAALNLLEDTERARLDKEEQTARRERAEAGEREAESRYRTLFHTIDEGFCIIEVLFDRDEKPVDYRFLEVNPSFERLTGIKDAVGRSIRELFPLHEQHWIDTYGRVAVTGEAVRFEHRAEQLGRDYDVHATRIGKPHERRVAVLFNDITERACAERALREAKEAAEAANRAKDRFLSMLSHELRTPLTPALMIVGALEQDPALPADVRADLAMVKRNVELEAKLIDDLLDLSRIGSGKLVLEIEPVDLNEIVRSAAAICQPVAEGGGVRLETELGDGIGRIPGDAVRLQQVVWNLIRNGIKFTPDGGSVTVRTARLSPERCEVRVRDTGIGIAPEVLPTIFKPFEQGDESITREFGGLGLGLAISSAVVEMHNGALRAESDGPGQGATFVVELPG